MHLSRINPTRVYIVDIKNPDRSDIIDISFFQQERLNPGTVVAVSSKNGLIRKGNILDCALGERKPLLETVKRDVTFKGDFLDAEAVVMKPAEFLRFEAIDSVPNNFSEIGSILVNFKQVKDESIAHVELFQWLFDQGPGLNAVCLSWLREPGSFLIHRAISLEGVRYTPKVSWMTRLRFGSRRKLEDSFGPGIAKKFELDETSLYAREERYVAIANPIPLGKFNSEASREFAEVLKDYYRSIRYERRP